MISEGITFIKAVNYEEMSRIAAGILIKQVIEKPNSLITLATGSTPTGMYRHWISQLKKEKIVTSQLRFHKLDEWWKIQSDNPASCEFYLRENILNPLNVSEDRYFGVSSEAKNPRIECDKIAKKLAEEGPSDICILGLGKNGHLGLNEPGNDISLHTHLVELTKESQNHSMLEQTGIKVSKGLTSGIKDILQSKIVIFLVSGKHKAELFSKFYNEQVVNSMFPASFLWLHKSVICIYDSDAGIYLQQ